MQVYIHYLTISFINSIILRVAEGSSSYLGADGDAQKSALQVIINCVCGPQYKVGIFNRWLIYVEVYVKYNETRLREEAVPRGLFF